MKLMIESEIGLLRMYVNNGKKSCILRLLESIRESVLSESPSNIYPTEYTDGKCVCNYCSKSGGWL